MTVWMLSEESYPVARVFANHRRFLEFVRAFTEAKALPLVIAPSFSEATLPTVAGAAQQGHPLFSRFPLAWPGIRTVRSWPWLYRKGRREQPAWVYVTNPLYAPAVWALKRRLGDELVVHVDVMGLHSLESQCGRESSLAARAEARAWHALERVLFSSADLLTTVNQRHADLVNEMSSKTAYVLRDGCDPIVAEDLPEASLPEQAAGLTVAFVGSLIRNRLGDLLAAVAAVDEQVSVIVIGDGPDRARYEREVQASPRLRTRVIFLGYRDQGEALALTSACDVAYSDCWSQAGFPYKLFEYMALGKAIVVEGKPQMGEVLTDGESALFYSGPAELTACLSRLAMDPGERERLGTRAKALLEAEHTRARRRGQLGDWVSGQRAAATRRS